ncbi:MAG TPA: ATP-binding protein [Trueperaceae bacterium]
MNDDSASPRDEADGDPQAFVSKEAQLHLATEAAGIGVWSRDLATGEMHWSETMYRLLGLPPGSPSTPDSFLARVHPEDRKPLSDALQSNGEQSSSSNASMEYRVIHPDGRIVWLSGRGRVVSDAAGRRVAHGVAVDITSEKEAEERERQLRLRAEDVGERLQFLAEASRILSSSLDYQETLVRVARLAVPRLADWCAVDLLDDAGKLERLAVEHQESEKVRLAHTIQQRYPPDPDGETGAYQVARSGKPELYREIPDELLEAGARDEEHLRLLREIGFSSALVVPLTSRGQTLGVLSLVQAESGRHYDENDLSLAMQLAERAALAVDNARLYLESLRSNDELEKRVAERTAELLALNRELEAFTYSASHDLRGPLRGIDGFAQALFEDYGGALDERALGYVQRIQAGAARLGTIIDALLALSRLNRSDFRRVPLDLTLKARDTLVRLREVEPDRRVEARVQEGLRARGDSAMVRLLLDNLIGNAWKFTSDQATARIEVGSLEQDGERVFYVSDNGIGFDMNYADKLFEPFQRLHAIDTYPGTGVGLATVARIVDRHGGRISAEGKPGEGATFYFTLGGADGAGKLA